MKIIVFLIALLLALPAFAADHLCIDILSLARQDMPMLVQNWPQGYYAGVVDRTFGDPVPNLERLAQTGRLGGFRAHLRNATCLRNRTCEALEPSLDDFASLAKDAAKYEAFHQSHPTLGCYLSPWLEHDVKDAAKVQRAVVTLRQSAPSCIVVVSAFTGYRPPGVLQEYHGNTARGDSVSNDGQQLWDAGNNYAKQGKTLACGWWSSLNKRDKHETKFIPPSQRTIVATRSEILRAVAKLQPAPPPPSSPVLAADKKGCKTMLPARDGDKRGFLWKESDSKKNAKGELVMITLLPKELRRPKVVEAWKGGKVISRLAYVYQYVEDGSDRAVFKTDQKASFFPPNVVLHLDDKCVVLDKPYGRID